MESSSVSHNPAKFAASFMLATLSELCSLGTIVAAALKLPLPTGVAENDDRDVSLRRTQICKHSSTSTTARESLNNLINLRSKLPYFRGKLFALLSVLPFRRLFTLNHLKQMNMLLLELLLLEQQLVKALREEQ
jgi:hypothetical protein